VGFKRRLTMATYKLVIRLKALTHYAEKIIAIKILATNF